MDVKVKNELIFEARSGCNEAMQHLLKNGVSYNEIFQTEEEMDNKIENSYNYIFVVRDSSWDNQTIELITTDFKKAFYFSYNHSYEFDVWVDGEDSSLLEVYAEKGLIGMYDAFDEIKNTRYKDLYEIAFPIIKEQKDKYEEERRKEEDVKNKKLRDKELKELARLKAKYESQ